MIRNELSQSPIYNLSMCSLEDFHTSFWKWLGNTYPHDFIQIFCDKKYSNETSIVFHNQVTSGLNARFDLYAEINSNGNTSYIVIENKLKSFPTEEQLLKYEDCMKNKQTQFVLLTLVPKIDVPSNWLHLNYLHLTQKMKSIFNDNFNYGSDYNKFLVEDYINIIDNISNAFQFDDTKKFDFYDVNEEIEKLHLRDIYIKSRGAMFTNILKENLHNCEVASSFNHGKNTIDITLVRNDIYDFRIQIEGNQFRYCFLPLWSDDEINKEKIANELLNSQLWFNNTEKYRKEFCKYGKNFIYRYQTIEKLFANNLKDITYQEIINLLNNEITTFNKNRKNIDSVISKYKK